jgi:hypothetical protein
MINNYYNYFTEVEEHFQRACGVTRLLSPRDWALVEQWRNGGVPLEAVLRGIDEAFKNRRKRTSLRHETVNSLAYCAHAVEEEARRVAASARFTPAEASSGFCTETIAAYNKHNANALRRAGYDDFADELEAVPSVGGPEEIEGNVQAIEDRMAARLYGARSDQELLELRRILAPELKRYRQKMNASQFVSLEKQLLNRRLLELSGLPRLSLFFLRT